MIFNEQAMYKDKSIVVSNVTRIDKNKSRFVNFDGLIESTIKTRGVEDNKNVNSQVDQSTLVVASINLWGLLDPHSVIHHL